MNKYLSLTIILSFLVVGFLVYNINNKSLVKIDTTEKVKSVIPNSVWYNKRAYPNGFDEKLFIKQMERIKTDAKQNSQTKAVNLTLPWIPEGPNNIGGKFNVLRKSPINSDVIYAGATNGGLFKTENGGSTWFPIFDDLAYLAIGSMAIDPTNDNTLYVGTGDKNFGGGSHIGNGIYKSTDGGTTWNNSGLSQTGIVTEVVIDPSNTQTIFAATLGNTYEQTNDRGVYKSIDGGNSWTNVLFISDTSGVIDLVMDPINSNILYASGFNRINLPYHPISDGPASRIYKTIDGGDTWSILTNGLPLSDNSRVGLAISETNSNVLYATYVSGINSELLDIYKTVDAGVTWTALNATSNGLDYDVYKGFGWYFGEIYINPYNINHIVVTGVDMYHSTDGGTTWQMNVPDWYTYEVHGDKHDVLFLAANEYIIATDGGLYKTIDNGSNWVDIDNIAVTQFYHIAVDPLTYGNYGGGAQDNGTTTGSGFDMNGWQRNYGGDGFRLTFSKDSPDEMYAETQKGGLVHIDMSIGNVTDLSPNLSNDRVNWDMPYHLDEDFGELYIGTSKISMTNLPANNSYTPISTDLTKVPLGTAQGLESRHTIAEIEMAKYNTNLMMVGTSDGLVWRGEQNNSLWNWTNVTQSNLPDRYVTGIRSSPNATGAFYITYSGYTLNDYSSYIYKTLDDGDTWIDISGNLPNGAINDICVVPGEDDDYLFTALDGGVYFSENGGVTWSYVGVNLPFVTAEELAIDVINSKLLVGTYSRSMYSYDISWITNLDADYTSISKNDNSPIKVYPNPTSDMIKIISPIKGEFKLFNLEGKLIESRPIKANQEVLINLKQLDNGMYLYSLGSESGKLIKK